MIEIVANTQHVVPLWKKFVPVILIVLAGTFAAGIFFSFMTGYSDNPEVKESIFVGSGGWLIALGISSLGVLVYMGVHISKKQVCKLVFNDEKRIATLGILPYWSNKLKEVSLPYSSLRFEKTVEENIKGEEAESISFYHELKFLGRMTANHPSWLLYPKAFKKVRSKLTKLKD